MKLNSKVFGIINHKTMNIPLRKDQLSPISYFIQCVYENDVAGVLRALAMGVKPDTYAHRMDGMTALFIASMNGNLVIMEILLLAGANPNKQDKNGRRPIHHAMGQNHVDAVKRLLDAGADPNSIDNSGRSLLYYQLLYKNHPPMIQLLLQYGATLT